MKMCQSSVSPEPCFPGNPAARLRENGSLAGLFGVYTGTHLGAARYPESARGSSRSQTGSVAGADLTPPTPPAAGQSL